MKFWCQKQNQNTKITILFQLKFFLFLVLNNNNSELFYFPLLLTFDVWQTKQITDLRNFWSLFPKMVFFGENPTEKSSNFCAFKFSFRCWIKLFDDDSSYVNEASASWKAFTSQLITRLDFFLSSASFFRHISLDKKWITRPSIADSR